MTEQAQNIEDAAGNLTEFWEGRPYEAFEQYATSTVLTLRADAGVMGNFNESLGQCAKIVYDTYAEMISALGKCAADLTGLEGYNLLFALPAAIPGVDVATGVAAANKAIGVMESFVRTVTDLITGAVKLMGESAKTSVSFPKFAANFAAPGSGPASAPGAWQVHPLPDSGPTNGRG